MGNRDGEAGRATPNKRTMPKDYSLGELNKPDVLKARENYTNREDGSPQNNTKLAWLPLFFLARLWTHISMICVMNEIQ